MDNPYNQDTGPEYTATPLTSKQMIEKATLVMDRKTGEMYNPQEAFDKLMNTPEVLASLKRLAVR
jgi:hypothetical protein